MPAFPGYSDQQLFQLIAEGDESAFREIFERYTPRLHPFVTGIVKENAIAREIVQEVFLRLWLNRSTAADIEKPSSWLYRVASNLSLTWFRRRNLEMQVLQNIGRDENSFEEEERLHVKELQQLIQQAVQALPPKRRTIFNLSREQGLGRREIARQLDISENTVKNQLGIALKFIQDHIQQHSGSYIPFLLLLTTLPDR